MLPRGRRLSACRCIGNRGAGAPLALDAEESHPPSRSVEHLIARPRPTKQQPILMVHVLELSVASTHGTSSD
jgi:hypothetical protein